MRIDSRLSMALIGLTIGLNAVIYENASDGKVDRWRVYNNASSSALIKNIIDEKKGRVIQLSSKDNLSDGFKLGGLTGEEQSWKNNSDRILKWSMKTNKDFLIFVSLKTLKGNRFLIYSSKEYSTGYTIGLGRKTKDGKWRAYIRDLDADLKRVDSNNTILSVNGFFVKGSGLFDDITLDKKETRVNLLEGKNPNVDGTDWFTRVENQEYSPTESHTDDGSGSIKIVNHWYTKSVRTATFRLEKGKHYTLGAYIKAIGLDRGENVMFKIAGPSSFVEMNWNISKAGQWEEIVMPYRAKETGDYYISIFTHRYALTTDGKYATKEGTNLERSATMYFDDFYVYESQDVSPNEPYTKKVPYRSSHIKIDEHGNWQIKEDGVWRDFFPKFTYQDFSKDFSKSARMYSSYGFTGFTNIKSTTQMHLAVDNGMKYNAIQVNRMDANENNSVKNLIKSITNEISEGKLPVTSLIMYEFDNENRYLTNYNHKKLVSDWLNENDIDPLTNKRARPIDMLNGMAEGVARNYKNRKDKDYLDIVSTYVTQSGNSVNQHSNPVNTLGILQKTQNQIAPVSIMQLQCYYHDVFIPSIFKGIGEGAKGLNFWRAGRNVPFGCPENFEDNVWAPAIKDVFSKIDQMLPIIKEPVGTHWSATVDNPALVSIATRGDKHGKHYIVLANFADRDLNVNINLENINAFVVRDYFTKKHITNISENRTFSVSIGHHNSGFRVLELE